MPDPKKRTLSELDLDDIRQIVREEIENANGGPQPAGTEPPDDPDNP